jgi:hypothetical protein
MSWLGDYPEDHAAVIVPFTTHSNTGAPVAPSSAFETSDFRIYKGASATEKATTNGLNINSPFDTVTGLHLLSIDTSNDTGDSGFWVSGVVYTVVLIPDETVDGVAVTKVVGQFGIDLYGGLRPETAGRKILVDADGKVTVDAVAVQTGGITDQSLDSSALVAITNAWLDFPDGIENGLTPKNALRLAAATIGGKLSGAGTGTETVRNAVADSKDRIIVTADASGNRSAIIYDFT